MVCASWNVCLSSDIECNCINVPIIDVCCLITLLMPLIDALFNLNLRKQDKPEWADAKPKAKEDTAVVEEVEEVEE